MQPRDRGRAAAHRSPPRSCVALVGVVLAACKGSHPESSTQDQAAPALPTDAASPDANLDACRAALPRIAGLPPVQRAQALLDACRPCGDWDPLLRWNTPVAEGGPPRAAIEQVMLACQAYCDVNAKLRFLRTLDSSRGKFARQPWRVLGDLCRAAVSAVPDTRFMTAPYFALDRIARAVAGPGLPAIAVPLPAVSITGVGVELPDAPAGTPLADPAVITVDASQFLLGTLPSATLLPTGLQLAGDYPGTRIEPAALRFALAAPGFAGPVTVLAPRALPATRIADAIAAAHRELRLAVALPGPTGWTLPGMLPVAMVATTATPGVTLALGGSADAAIAAARTAGAAELHRGRVTIAVDEAATTESLASLLVALGSLDVASVSIVRQPGEPARMKPLTKPPGRKP